MAAEDSGVCQLHSISEDSVNSGHGTSSGIYLYTQTHTQSRNEKSYFSCLYHSSLGPLPEVWELNGPAQYLSFN